MWITAEGQAFRRYNNPVSKLATWEDMPLALDQETQTRLGIHAPSWMSIEVAIATAWLHRSPGSQAHVRVLDLGAPQLGNLEWGEPEARPEEGEFEGETWAPLRWQCGQTPCDPRYKISSHGRLMNYRGVTTRGFAALGTRWAACRGAGLVNLMQASGLMRAEKQIPDRVYLAYCSLSSSIPVTEHAKRHGLTTKTAWQYYQLAAPVVHDRHVYGREVVPPALWRALLSLRGHGVLGGPLKQLHPLVERAVGGRVSFEALRFARTCVV